MKLYRQTFINTFFRRDADEAVPDVPQAVQELFLSLFTSFYNHQDEEGRCFSDSLAELPEYDDTDGNKYVSLKKKREYILQ